MNKRWVAMGAVGALLLPVVLALAAYFVSARSFATTGQAIRAPLSKIGRPRKSPSPSPRESSGSDVSRNCDEAGHQNVPACASPSPSGTKDDSGGGGSSSGKGSDDSASSGSGSGKSDDSASSTSVSSGSSDSGSGGADSEDSGSGGSGSSGGDD